MPLAANKPSASHMPYLRAWARCTRQGDFKEVTDIGPHCLPQQHYPQPPEMFFVSFFKLCKATEKCQGYSTFSAARPNILLSNFLQEECLSVTQALFRLTGNSVTLLTLIRALPDTQTLNQFHGLLKCNILCSMLTNTIKIHSFEASDPLQSHHFSQL